jgi:hypothetical protein
VAIGLLLFAVTTFANGGLVGLTGKVRDRFLLDDAGHPVAEVAVPDHHGVNAHD